MKATGAEIWAFWMNGWPRDWESDERDSVESPEGDCLLEMDREYDLDSFGYICWAGQGPLPNMAPADGKDTVRFSKWFAFWKKNTSTVAIAVTMPRKDESIFRSFCQKHGWKVEGGA